MGLAVPAGALAHAPHPVQLGEGVDAQSEPLVVADVEVQEIELVHRHRVYEFFYDVHAVKMAAHVQHSRAVRVTRFVEDRAGGDVRLFLPARQLAERHGGVEQSLVVRRSRLDAGRSDFQDVIPFRIRFAEDNRRRFRRASEHIGDDGKRRADFHIRTERETSFRRFDEIRFRDNVHISSLVPRTAARRPPASAAARIFSYHIISARRSQYARARVPRAF